MANNKVVNFKQVEQLGKDFDQAEKKARSRDFQIDEKKFREKHNGTSKEDVEKALELLKKATGKDIDLNLEEPIKVKFVQIMQENMGYLRDKKYLTSAEKSFLYDIAPNIGYSSNCIVLDNSVKNPTPATIKEIADIMGRERSTLNKTINSLKKKGVLAKAESGIEGNNALAYAIFINPNLMFNGNRSYINETLKAMFKKAMKGKYLKDLPIKLF